MKRTTELKQGLGIGRLGTALAITGMLAFGGLVSSLAAQTPKVLPSQSSPYGKTYGEWSAAWWTWAMELPLSNHPLTDTASPDVSAGQSGPVWFLGAPFGSVVRACTVPTGKALFVGLMNAEASDLEGLGATEEERRATAEWLSDHIVYVSCTIDGVPVADIDAYRAQSPEFSFTAPSPWLFGETGGEGLAVADGYFVMVAPLSVGTHTIHIGGRIVFSTADGDPFDAELLADNTLIVTVE